jgi:CHAT domain-containing protein
MEEIEKRNPDYAALINPKALSLAEAQALLKPGEALIAIYVGESESYVWAAPAGGAASFARVALGAGEVERLVASLRRALNPNAATLGEIPAFDVAAAHRLYQALLEPVKAGWAGAERLIVAPHGALAQLPFGLLVTAPAKVDETAEPLFAGYKSVPWLIRDHGVSLVPSVQAFAVQRRLPAVQSGAGRLAAFGDPIFAPGQEAQVAAAPDAQALTARGVIAVRGLPVKLRSAPQTAAAASAQLAALPPLPETAEEVRAIAVALSADPAQSVFTGAEASEAQVKAMNLADRRVVVFATHGLVPGDLDGLTQPALALSSPQAVGGGEDGLLTMGEILGLKLDADWVVLSACNTASGEGAGAEAISGLGRAFFYAGARALLVSNWPVETTSARALTSDLFRRQAGTGAAKDQALRQAMLALIDGPGFIDAKGEAVFSYAHPIFWAPFSLVGDPG